MRKQELVDVISETADLSPKEADDVLSATLEQLTNALARGENITLIGFGTFSMKNRAARVGRNPRTGEEINISASNQVVFKPGKQLKQALN